MGSVVTGPSLTIGGRVFTDLDNLIILGSTGNNGGEYGTFVKDSTGIFYSPSGVNFRILAIQMNIIAASNQNVLIFQSDNTVGFDTASPPAGTNVGYLSNGLGNYNFHHDGAHPAAEYPVNFLINDGKFVTERHQNAIASHFLLFGYEEAL